MSTAISVPSTRIKRSSAGVAKSGRCRKPPCRICSMAWAWSETPGTEASSGVALRSSRPAALVPMIRMRPLELVRADVAVQNLPGGQIALLRLRGEPDPHLAVGFGRHLEVADLHGNDAGLFAKRLLAARARGLHQIGRCALREPEHLGRQSGIERVADAHQHGHAADDLILLGNPVERARALRLVLQLREARRRARVMRSEQLRDRRRHGRSPPWSWAARWRRGEAMKPSTTGPLPIASAKTWSLVGSFSTSSRRLARASDCRPVAQRVGGRHAVGLGEDHVEADRRRAARDRACRRVRQARYAATAIAQSASTTPRRYRRCAPAKPDRTRAGRGADRHRRRATAASRPASGPRHATPAQPR